MQVGEQLVLMVRKYDMRTQASLIIYHYNYYVVPFLKIYIKYLHWLQALSSYVFIAANVILHATKENQSRHLVELLPPIVPLLTSHHHSLRGFTQV